MNRYKMHEQPFDQSKKDLFWDFVRSDPSDYLMSIDEMMEKREQFRFDPITDVLTEKAKEFSVQPQVFVIKSEGHFALAREGKVVHIPFSDFWK